MLYLRKKRDRREYARRNPARVNTNYYVSYNPAMVEHNLKAIADEMARPPLHNRFVNL